MVSLTPAVVVQINPAWQKVGLGRALMERLLGGLLDAGIPAITLYADPKVITLYEKLGFAKDPQVFLCGNDYIKYHVMKHSCLQQPPTMRHQCGV